MDEVSATLGLDARPAASGALPVRSRLPASAACWGVSAALPAPLQPPASRAPPCLFDPARTFFLIRFPISRSGIAAGIDRVTLSRARVYSVFNEESGPMGVAFFRPTSWNLEVF